MKTYDVLIVGGGIIGGSIALELAERGGMHTAIVDRQAPGREASWAAAGMLASAPETPDAITLLPLSKASLEMYPKYVAGVEALSGRHAEFRREGTLHAFFRPEAERELSTAIAIHHGLGLATEAIRVEEARRMEPAMSDSARVAVWLPYEAQVDCRILTEAVLAAAQKRGVEFLTPQGGANAPVIEAGRCTGVRTASETLRAKNVVIAAGCYSSQIESIERYAPTRPVRGQIVALRPKEKVLGHVLRSERGYLVPREDGRIIAGSTSENAGYEKAVTPAGLQHILSAAVEMVPALAQATVEEFWSGLRPDTPDHLPVIGPTDIEGLVIATGHYRNGILLAPITGQLVREWITERRTSIPLDNFSPLRFQAHTAQAG